MYIVYIDEVVYQKKKGGGLYGYWFMCFKYICRDTNATTFCLSHLYSIYSIFNNNKVFLTFFLSEMYDEGKGELEEVERVERYIH